MSFNDIFMYMCFSKTPALSPTEDCRPFDARADGTMLGEGIGLLALRRLADAERDGDRIYAVIRGVGSSSDGRAKSIYAPVAEGQAKALRRAYDVAGYGPGTVELVEAHGTGTKAGDVAEFEGLRMVFDATGRADRQWCALGSVKSQIGTQGAAGAASLFKIVMALLHKLLPPTIKVEQPAPGLEIEKSPFYLNTEARPWIRGGAHPRRASVSSFGFGGSNFHVTAEEYAGPAPRARRFAYAPAQLVTLSDADPSVLAARCGACERSIPRRRAAPPRAREPAGFDLGCRRGGGRRHGREPTSRRSWAKRRSASRASPGRSTSRRLGTYYAFGVERGKLAFPVSGPGQPVPGHGPVTSRWPMAPLARRGDAAADARCRYPLHEVVFPRPVFSERGARRAEAAVDGDRVGAARDRHRERGAAAAAARARRWTATSSAATASRGDGAARGWRPRLRRLPARRPAARRADGRGRRLAAGAMLAVAHAADALGELIEPWRGEVVVANHNSPRQVCALGAATAIDQWPRAAPGAGHSRRAGCRSRRPSTRRSWRPRASRSSPSSPRFPSRRRARPVYANSEAAPYPADDDAMRDGWPRRSRVRCVSRSRSRRCTAPARAPSSRWARAACSRSRGSASRAARTRRSPPTARASTPREPVARARAADRGRGERVFRALWENLALPADPRTRKRPALALAVSGANYAKALPTPGRRRGAAKPNPPRARQEEPSLSSSPKATGSSAPPRQARSRPDPSPPFPRRPKPPPPGPRAEPSGPDALAWVEAYQEVQRQTAEAHEAYLRTTAETHAPSCARPSRPTRRSARC